MVGWDFSRLEGRLTADDPWWDFEADCAAALATSTVGALDLGTGGGERLTALVKGLNPHQQPTNLIATEGWEPNVPVAREQLAPLGIDVLAHDSERGDRLPLRDDSVDLVMCRHESFDADDLARVLCPGGRFLTQQVDGFDAPEIHDWFGDEFLHPEVTAEVDVARLEAAGLRIDQVDEWEGSMRFSDVEALVIYLGFVPWDAPGFAVEDHADRLLELDAAGPIVVTQRRYRVYASR